MQVRSEVISFFLFLATLFFAPLAFGTTENWSIITVELLVALAGIFYFLPSAGKKASSSYYRVPGILPLLLLLAWMLLQLIPLPLSLVRIVAPNICQAYQPILTLPTLGNLYAWLPLTVNYKETLLEVLRLSSYALFYVLTIQLLTSSRKLRLTITLVTGLAICIAFFAILQRITAPDTLFWFRKLSDGKQAFGPWVYKNHYAGFMVMLCPLVLSQFFLYRPVYGRADTLRGKIVAFFSESKTALYLGWGFGSIVIFASVFLTQSRGGILSIICSLLFFLFFISRQQEKIGKAQLFILFAGFLILVGWYSWEPISDRFLAIFDSETGRVKDDRLLIWQDTFQIIKDFFLTGSGFGTFVDIFPSYKTLPDDLLYDHAHNDFLELLSNGGVPAGLLGGWFIASVLHVGYKMIHLRRDSFSVFPAVGAFSGLAGLLVYSGFDFNLHNGANGLYFFFLAGLLVSAGNTRRYYQDSPTLLPLLKPNYWRNILVFTAILAFFGATLFYQGRKVWAERKYRKARQVSSLERFTPVDRVEKMSMLLEEARAFDPVTGLYSHTLAKLKSLQGQDKQAVRLSAEAVRQQSMSFTFLQQLGHVVAATDLELARNLLKRGYERADQKKLAFQTWAAFELSQRTGKEGRVRLRREVERDPRMLASLYQVLIKYQVNQKYVAEILPQKTSSWLGFWNKVKNEKRSSEFHFIIEHALDFIDNDSKVLPQYFSEVFHYYRTQKKDEKSGNVLQVALRYLPDYVPFHILLGEIYLKKGKKELAIKQYEQAAVLDPENSEIQRRVKVLRVK
nr:O-antigen ligase family protein [Candidatus Electrothrix aestuarii]